MDHPTAGPVAEVQQARAARLRLLRTVTKQSELPLLLLAVVWLGLFVAEMVGPLPRWAEILGACIWIVFLLDLGLRLLIAPRKLRFLRRNVLAILSLLVPALRLLRFARLFALGRGMRVVRLVGSLNRSRTALHRTLHRRRTAYVALLTLLVTLGGAAAMHYFERGQHPVFAAYGSSLWWTAMVVVTMGTEAWPATPEGRLVCLFLAGYGFAMLGYIAATLSAFLIGTDADATEPPAPSPEQAQDVAAVLETLRELERQIAHLRPQDLPPPTEGGAPVQRERTPEPPTDAAAGAGAS